MALHGLLQIFSGGAGLEMKLCVKGIDPEVVVVDTIGYRKGRDKTQRLFQNATAPTMSRAARAVAMIFWVLLIPLPVLPAVRVYLTVALV